MHFAINLGWISIFRSSKKIARVVGLTCIIFCATLILCEGKTHDSVCGENFHDLLGKACFRVYDSNSKLSWNNAYNICESQQSFLVQLQNGLTEDLAAALFKKLSAKRIKEIWIGLRRKNGYLQWLGNTSQLHQKQKKYPGSVTWGNEEPRSFSDECVSLKISMREMQARPCDSFSFAFVCIAPLVNTSLNSPVPYCPAGWKGHKMLPNTCLLIGETATWDVAQSYCRKNAAEIISASIHDKLNSLSIHADPKQHGYWINENITSKSQSRCRINLPTQKLSCDSKYLVICQSFKYPEISVKLFANNFYQIHETVLWLDKNQNISIITLSCQIRANGKLLKSNTYKDIRYYWLKNDIPMEIDAQLQSLLFPAHWGTPSQFVSRNFSDLFGTYKCQAKIPGLNETYESNQVTIFPKGFQTFVVNINLTINKSINERHLDMSTADSIIFYRLNHTLHKLFSEDLSDVYDNGYSWWFVHSIVPIATQQLLSSKQTNIQIKMILSTPSGGKLLELRKREVRSVGSNKFYTIKRDSIQIDRIDHCSHEQGVFGNTTYMWSLPKEKDTAYSNPECFAKSSSHVKSFRKCRMVYNQEPIWDEFPYENCMPSDSLFSSNFCSSGFHQADNMTCIRQYVLEENEVAFWDEANEMCLQQHARLSPPLGNESLYSGTGMWLYKKFNGKLIFKKNKYDNNNVFGETSNCPLHQFSKEGSYEIFNNCKAKLPFLCSKPKLMSFLAEVTWCPQGWFGSDLFSLREQCFYFHLNQDTSFQEANAKCISKGGHLAVASDTQTKSVLIETTRILLERDVFPRGLLVAFWVGLVSKNNKLFWNAAEHLIQENTMKIPDDRLSNYAGILDTHQLQWKLREDSDIFGFICQKRPEGIRKNYRRNPTVTLTKLEEIVGTVIRTTLVCDGRKVHPNSFVSWYLNGDFLNTDNQNIVRNADTDYSLTIDRRLPDSRIIAQLKLPLLSPSIEGQFQCVIDGSEHISPASSNHLLVSFPGNKSFILHVKLIQKDISSENEDNLFSLIGKIKKWTPKSIQITEIRQFSRNGILDIFIKFFNDSTGLEWSSFDESMKSLMNSNTFNATLEYKLPAECVAETTFDQSGNSLDWPSTQLGHEAMPRQLCCENGNLLTRKCEGDFIRGAQWEPFDGHCTDVPNDVTLNLRLLSQIDVNDGTISAVSSNLSQITSNNLMLKPIDMRYIAETMQKIATINDVPKNILKHAAETIDHLLNIDDQKFQELNEKSNSSARIMEAFENIIDNVEYTSNDPLRLNLESVFVESFVPSMNSIVGLKTAMQDAYQFDTNQIVTLMVNEKLNYSTTDVALILPTNLIVNQTPNDRVTFVVYETSKLFFSPNHDGIKSQKFRISSRVISAKVTKTHDKINPPVKIIFHVPQINSMSQQFSCVFWDYGLNDGRGDWSEEGCSAADIIEERLVCECNHLTNFAVLMDMYGQENSIDGDHSVVLDLISYIGCALSIVGLILTILTFIIFKNWRKKDGNKVLCNLSVTLLMVAIVFLGGIDQVDSPILCTGAAVLLHYFLLVAFCWMLVEAWLQYMMFVRVMNTYIPRFIIKAMTFAWGTPLIIIVIVLSINVELYRGGHSYCWMKLQALYFAFLLPVGCIIIINSVIFALVIRSISCERKNTLRTNQSKRQMAIIQFHAAVCIFTLLGFTWVFGYLAIAEARIIFQYLFCICNSLQGIFIFIFMVVRDRNAKESWIAFLRKSSTSKPRLIMSSVRSSSSSGPKSNGVIRRY